MLPLLKHPDQFALLRDEPAQIATAVDEFIRWASPITHEARTVLAPVTIGDVEFSAGDRVAVWSPSANRDEQQFPDPFLYDVTRQPNKHLSFAFGEHFCLGADLARLALKVEFQEILKRFQNRSSLLANRSAYVPLL